MISRIEYEKIRALCAERARKYAYTNAIEELIDMKKDGEHYDLPIAIKNNIAIKGKHLTCSSSLLQNYVPSYSATCVNKLIACKWDIMATCRLAEFAVGSTSLPHIKGLFRPDVCAGGSSSGSAVAVSCGIAPVSLGSDTGGSVIAPSSLNGIYGFKPTYGAISRYGLVPLAHSLEQIGILAQRSKDLFRCFCDIAGVDIHDQTTIEVNSRADTPSSLVGKKCGYDLHTFECMNATEQRLFMNAINLLREQGVQTVVYEEPIVPLQDMEACYSVLSGSELVSNMSRYGGSFEGQECSVVKRGALSILVKQRLALGMFALLHRDAMYEPILQLAAQITESVQKRFKEIDFYAYPSILLRGDSKQEYSIMANLSHSPVITLPTERIDNLPFGVAIQGRKKEDYALLSVSNLYDSLIKPNICYDPLTV